MIRLRIDYGDARVEEYEIVSPPLTPLGLLRAAGVAVRVSQCGLGCSPESRTFILQIGDTATEHNKFWSYTVTGELLGLPVDQVMVKQGDLVEFLYRPIGFGRSK